MGKKLYQLTTNEKDLPRVLTVMAKADGVIILHAEPEGNPRFHSYVVYYECEPSVRKFLRVRFNNAGLSNQSIGIPDSQL